MLEIIVNMDTVEIEGRIIGRPDRISRYDWMHYWEAVQRLDDVKVCPEQSCHRLTVHV